MLFKLLWALQNYFVGCIWTPGLEFERCVLEWKSLLLSSLLCLTSGWWTESGSRTDLSSDSVCVTCRDVPWRAARFQPPRTSQVTHGGADLDALYFKGVHVWVRRRGKTRKEGGTPKWEATGRWCDWQRESGDSGFFDSLCRGPLGSFVDKYLWRVQILFLLHLWSQCGVF